MVRARRRRRGVGGGDSGAPRAAGGAVGVRHGFQLPEPLRGIVCHMPAAGMTWVPPRVARHAHLHPR